MTTTHVDFNTLEGKTIVEVTGLHNESEEVIFTSECGSRYKMYHEQDCCEYVRLYDLDGSSNDFLNTPIITAEETSKEGSPSSPSWEDSTTWTFYKIRTIKGSITLRWLGESNGYYSESVDFVKLND